ncbi:MAG: helix-turn-helix transcriptional regulator [Armatimonadetes bacterium]|nr:helix-turn-helix transcriptional regulator [Armatimonadota bacterium]
MSRVSVPLREVEKEFFKDPEFAAAFEELAPEYDIARQIIRARLKMGMTQKQLAEKVGTRQSNISRLESGEQNMSIGMLKKVAKGLGKRLRVSIA